ncbi:MAG: cytochrome c biogenesis protein CcsA [Magnetococcus sp. DMHC-6]
MTMEWELIFLWVALGLLTLTGVVAVIGLVLAQLPERLVLLGMSMGLIFHTLSLALRWERLGHGPFISQFEILSSNIWSLTLFFTWVYARFRLIRSLAGVVIPILFLMMGWLLVVRHGDTFLPPTYDTIWLYIHIGLGKVFLGAALVAASLGVVVISRVFLVTRTFFVRLPNDNSLDELSYRFLALALIFNTLMLISGAIWAQDAWGRYWAWDPLEIWSLINWLLIAMALHVRPLFSPPPVWGGVVAILVFMVAFLNFFGVPFLSTATHQGMI